MTESAEHFTNDAFAFFGGGGGLGGFNFCQKAQDVAATATGGFLLESVPSEQLREQESARVNRLLQTSGATHNMVDVKESLIWSTVCLCVPGVFHNLNKLRQIQCKYATCMARDVKERGIPISFCKDTRSSQICQFVIGEIFMLFPIVQIFNNFLNMFKEAFSNPFAAVALVSGCLCGGCEGFSIGGTTTPNLCKSENTVVAYGVCAIPKTIARIGDAVASIQGIIKPETWKTGNDFCDELDEVKSKRKEVSTPETTTTTLTKAEKEEE